MGVIAPFYAEENVFMVGREQYVANDTGTTVRETGEQPESSNDGKYSFQ